MTVSTSVCNTQEIGCSITGASRSSGRAVPCDAADVRNPHHCCYTTSAPFESSHRLPVYVSPLYGTAGTTAKRDVVMQRDPGLQSEDIRRCSSFRRALVRPFSHRAVTALIFTCTLVAFWERMGFSIAFTEIATEMDLTETEKGSVFAAYYYGFAVTQIPGGYLAKRFGGKAILCLSFLLWVPISALMAVPAGSPETVVAGVVVCRLAIGMAQGMFLPAAHSVLGYWIPTAHRGRHFAFAMSGMFAGAAVAMVTVPSVVSGLGASFTFHIAACLGAAWLLTWMCAGSDAPSWARQSEGLDPSGERWTDAGQGGGAAAAVTDVRRMSVDTDGTGEDDITLDDHWASAGIMVTSAPPSLLYNNCMLFKKSDLHSLNPNTKAEADSPIARTADELARPVSTSPGADEAEGDGNSDAMPPLYATCVTDHEDNDREKHVSSCPRAGPIASSSGARFGTDPGVGGAGSGGGTSGGWSNGRISSLNTTAPSTPNEGPSEALRAAVALANESLAAAATARARYLEQQRRRAHKEEGAQSKGVGDRVGGRRAFKDCYGNSARGSYYYRARPKVGGDRSVEKVAPYAESGTACRALGLPPTYAAAVAFRGDGTREMKSDGQEGDGDGDRDGAVSTTATGDERQQRSRDDPRTFGDSDRCTWSASSPDSSRCSGSESGGRQADGTGGNRFAGKNSSRRAPASDDGVGLVPKKENGFLSNSFLSVRGNGTNQSDKATPFPWRSMATNPAAWACVAGNVGAGTGINVVMSWLPTYFEDFIRIDLQDIGLAAQLSPYLTMMVFSVLGGVLYSWLISARGVSVASSSKIITGVAFFLALGVFLSMGRATSAGSATLLSSLALASVALSRGGWATYHVEIAAPEHAAMLYSVANCVSAATSVVGISLTGKLLDAFGGVEESLAWTAAMGSIGVLCGFCGLFFVCFARGNKVIFPGVSPAQEASSGSGDDADDEEVGSVRAGDEEGQAEGVGDGYRENETPGQRTRAPSLSWPRPVGWSLEFHGARRTQGANLGFATAVGIVQSESPSKVLNGSA